MEIKVIDVEMVCDSDERFAFDIINSNGSRIAIDLRMPSERAPSGVGKLYAIMSSLRLDEIHDTDELIGRVYRRPLRAYERLTA